MDWAAQRSLLLSLPGTPQPRMNPERWLPEVKSALLSARETFIKQVDEKVRMKGEGPRS